MTKYRITRTTTQQIEVTATSEEAALDIASGKPDSKWSSSVTEEVDVSARWVEHVGWVEQ